MKKHTELAEKVVHEGNKIPGCMLWTNPTSFAYVGRGEHITGKNGARYVVIKNGTGEWFGLCRGSADVIGFYKKKVYVKTGFESYIPVQLPCFVALEIKTGKDTLKPEQLSFKKQMQVNNVIYGIIRKIEDLYTILGVEK